MSIVGVLAAEAQASDNAALSLSAARSSLISQGCWKSVSQSRPTDLILHLMSLTCGEA